MEKFKVDTELGYIYHNEYPLFRAKIQPPNLDGSIGLYPVDFMEKLDKPNVQELSKLMRIMGDFYNNYLSNK